MKELKILYLYPDILELYGDFGNIQVLRYRLEQRGFNALIDSYSLGDNPPDFKSYDIVFAGGGADQEQSILSGDLIKYKDPIKEAIDNGVFFLLICGSYQLFGKYYKDVNGNIIPGLKIFDYYTEAINDRKKRCIGNIVIEATINNTKTKIIGFENHGGQTFDVTNPFGNVLLGNGNKFNDTHEGYFTKDSEEVVIKHSLTQVLALRKKPFQISLLALRIIIMKFMTNVLCHMNLKMELVLQNMKMELLQL